VVAVTSLGNADHDVADDATVSFGDQGEVRDGELRRADRFDESSLGG
jgi:hypothetical protein